MLYSSINFLIWDKVYIILLLVKNSFEIIATYVTYKKLPNIFNFFKKPLKNRIFDYRKKLKRYTKIHLYILYQVIEWSLWS
jgi:hypothetical protein